MVIRNNPLCYKIHFFIFNAALGAIIPFLSIYARQLGFSAATVGLLLAVLPITGVILIPVFTLVTEKLKISKVTFILLQCLLTICLLVLYVLPDDSWPASVELDCGNGVTVLRGCYQTMKTRDECRALAMGAKNKTAICDMNCDMTSPKMWQTVCEHWHIPQYCYSNTDNIQYDVLVTNATIKDQCAYIGAQNVTLDGYKYTPGCRVGKGFVDVNEPCTLNCTSKDLNTAIGKDQANMTCVSGNLNYRVCSNNTADLDKKQFNSNCKVSCDLEETTPWRLMEICEGWGADEAATCKPKTKVGDQFPRNLSFTGSLLMSTAISEHDCVYMQLNHIELPDGSTHYPNCVSKAQYQVEAKLFHTQCEIKCNDSLVNQMFQEANVQSPDVFKNVPRLNNKPWAFFVLMGIVYVAYYVLNTMAESACFTSLDDDATKLEFQKLWGVVGWGVFALLSGISIDTYSDGDYKNYCVAFIIMIMIMPVDVLLAVFLKIDTSSYSVDVDRKAALVLSSWPTCVFLIWLVAVGIFTSLLQWLLLWHVEDIATTYGCSNAHIATLQGLIIATNAIFGTIPGTVFSGAIIKWIGLTNIMSVVLFTFGLRFILYSVLSNSWAILGVELVFAVGGGAVRGVVLAHAQCSIEPETQRTVQLVTTAIYDGVGISLGSVLGGRFYGSNGGWAIFQWFGIVALLLCSAHILLTQLIWKEKLRLSQGPSSAIRYQHPNDTVFILDDNKDGS